MEIQDLNLSERAKRVSSLSEVLSPGGIVLIAEPADLAELGAGLRTLPCELSRNYGFSVISPCIRGWTKNCRPERCWSFVEKSPVRTTRFMEAVSDNPEGYRFRNTDIKFSFAILSKTCITTSEKPLPGDKKLRHCQSFPACRKKIDINALVMSGGLGNQNTHLWKLCDRICHRNRYMLSCHRIIVHLETGRFTMLRPAAYPAVRCSRG